MSSSVTQTANNNGVYFHSLEVISGAIPSFDAWSELVFIHVSYERMKN